MPKYMVFAGAAVFLGVVAVILDHALDVIDQAVGLTGH